MKIVTLIEDTCNNTEYKYEHGLSFYVETTKHKILIDTGATDAFIDNAKKLDIKLTDVDIVILTHGHYDHCGGVTKLIKINPCVRIYMQKSAIREYYNLKNNNEKYIGIDKTILDYKSLVLLDGDIKIDDELYLFSNIKGNRYIPKGNVYLKEKVNETYKQDVFNHEQCLVIKNKGKHILISGCAHNGILNILDTYRQRFDDNCEDNHLDMVISGFHMIKEGMYDKEDIDMIISTANELRKMNTIFYTGHCTGKDAFDIMKKIMQDRIVCLHSGTIILDE